MWQNAHPWPSRSITPRPVTAPARAHRASLIVLTLVFLAGVLFIVQAALPYFAADRKQFGVYWPRRWWLLGTTAAISAWACWALPLLITEVVLQGKKIVAVTPA